MDKLISRLNELSDAVTKGASGSGEFTMRVPAEPDRDADLVLARAAMELERLSKESLKFYNADGSFIIGESAEHVIEARKQAAEAIGKYQEMLLFIENICTGENQICDIYNDTQALKYIAEYIQESAKRIGEVND